MKKYIIILAALIAFAGCANVKTEQVEIPSDVDKVDTDIKVDEDTADATNEPMPEFILISGIIEEINDYMVTVTDVDGLGAETTVIIKISDETKWDVSEDMMKVTQRITAEISPMMTRSIPPQSNAIKIVSLNDIILGEVTNIDESAITLKPVSDFYNHEEVVMLLGDETIWDVEKDSVNVGNFIRVVADNKMTASIPPQVPCLQVLSVETHD